MAWSCRLVLRAPTRDPSLLAQSLGDGLLVVELRAAPRDLLRRHLGDVLKVELPVRGRAPDERRLHAGTRSRRRLQHTQSQLQRKGLRGRVFGPARSIAKREGAEQQARHTHM